MCDVECIIVGQGLAGSVLGYKLWQKGITFKIFSQLNMDDASWVAGGVVNPITGRNMQPSWQIDAILPSIIPFYQSLNMMLAPNIFQNIGVYKIMDSVAHLNDWQSKPNGYYGDVISPSTAHINAAHGLGTIKHSFRVDTALLVASCRDMFLKENFLIEEYFEYSILQIEEEKVLYKDICAKYIIFAEGYKARFNPWFEFIPWTFAKGEVLVIHCPDLKIDITLNKNLLVIPLGDDHYKVGATFDRHNMNTQISEVGREELIDKLNSIINCPYTVVSQQAAIRPTSRDRKPIIGRHPDCNNVYVFNGIGTKGVTQAPYYADRLIEYIGENKSLDSRVDVRRYYSL